jgi:predicted phosphoribosyltransferase
MNCAFDVILGSHVRVEGTRIVGAVAEDGDAVLDPEYSPRFDEIEALNEALEKSRRAIKTERVLFRGSRPLRSLEGAHVIIIDGQITSPWKVLAAAEAVLQLGAPQVAIAAPVSTQQAQERVRGRRFDFISPSVLLDPDGHKRPYGDPVDASAERLRSIVLARQAA